MGEEDNIKQMLTLLLVVLPLTACNPAAILPAPPATEPQCAYMWDTENLPDVPAQVQSAMQAAGLEGITVSAQAFGENNSCGGFGAMETDYRFMVPVEGLERTELLGAQLERLLMVLDDFPVDKTPGPNPGSIKVTFTADSQELNLSFQRQAWDAARTDALQGEALLSALENK